MAKTYGADGVGVLGGGLGGLGGIHVKFGKIGFDPRTEPDVERTGGFGCGQQAAGPVQRRAGAGGVTLGAKR